MEHAVYGIAKTRAQAVSVVEQLRSTGFSGEDIPVLFPDTAGKRAKKIFESAVLQDLSSSTEAKVPG